MSYKDPIIKSFTDPKGVDLVIQTIRDEVNVISWIDKSFGRAFTHTEKRDSKVIKVPKCFDGNDYINVLPNDNFKSMSFISVDGAEKWNSKELTGFNFKTRSLSIICWFNQKKITDHPGEFAISNLKYDLETSIIRNQYVKEITGIYDEKVEDIFRGYAMSDVDTQYLMWPYGGVRIDFTVCFKEQNC